jgi:hypothetical protein
MSLHVTTTRDCPTCSNNRKARKTCDACGRTGYETTTALEGIWRNPGVVFLVCGGPSLRTIDLAALQARGVVSVGVNNAGAYARTSAWVFSDPQKKFHHSGFLDPRTITFAPTPKLCRHVRVKHRDTEQFQTTDFKVRECPNTWGYSRTTIFNPETFLTDPQAHWGYGGKAGEHRPMTKLNTMLLGLRITVYLGGTTIYLVGVDFDDGAGEYAWKGQAGGFRGAGKSETMLKLLRGPFERAGIQVYNCNPKSKLRAYPYRRLGEALEDAQGRWLTEPHDFGNWYDKGPVNAEKQAGTGQWPLSHEWHHEKRRKT